MIKVKPKLHEILRQKGMSQMDLSELTGIPQGTISRFDRNDRHDASYLFTIAKALEISIEDLFRIVE